MSSEPRHWMVFGELDGCAVLCSGVLMHRRHRRAKNHSLWHVIFLDITFSASPRIRDQLSRDFRTLKFYRDFGISVPKLVHMVGYWQEDLELLVRWTHHGGSGHQRHPTARHLADCKRQEHAKPDRPSCSAKCSSPGYQPCSICLHAAARVELLKLANTF